MLCHPEDQGVVELLCKYTMSLIRVTAVILCSYVPCSFCDRKLYDVENYRPSKKKSQLSKLWLPDFQLYQSDRDILLSPTGWLSDTIVNAAQQLLKQQFPELCGLQSVVLGLLLSFDIQRGEFLQIINTTHQHWLTVSTIGLKHPVIQVFDSLYNSLPTMAQAQIATMMCTMESSIKVQVMDVQKQVK